MASPDSPVGSTWIPVPTGDYSEKFADPVVEALLDFGAWYIKDTIDAKLAMVPPGNILDAVPATNRFSFDPASPRGHHIKLPLPSLYMWWDGDSTRVEWTTVYDMRERFVHVMYVFPELPAMEEMNRRSGLLNAVDTAFHKMSNRMLHPSYGYGTSPPGTLLTQSLGAYGVMDWRYEGGTPGRFGIDEGPLAHRRAAKRSGRDYPAIRGRFRIQELILQDALIDPDDVTPDIPFGINGSDGESAEVVHIMDRVLTAPDGSEDL